MDSASYANAVSNSMHSARQLFYTDRCSQPGSGGQWRRPPCRASNQKFSIFDLPNPSARGRLTVADWLCERNSAGIRRSRKVPALRSFSHTGERISDLPRDREGVPTIAREQVLRDLIQRSPGDEESGLRGQGTAHVYLHAAGLFGSFARGAGAPDPISISLSS